MQLPPIPALSPPHPTLALGPFPPRSPSPLTRFRALYPRPHPISRPVSPFSPPTEPYGLFQIPAGPYEPAHNVSANPTAPLPNLYWRLDSTEAIVVMGCTPPLAEYFGFTGYVVNTYNPVKNAWTQPFGSLGDTLNMQRLAVFGDGASSVYHANQVYVFTADATTFASIQATLVGLGIPSGAVNLLPIPAAGWNLTLPNGQQAAPINMGLSQFSDTFTMLMRINHFLDTAAAAAYISGQPFRLVRVTPSQSSGHVPSLLGPATSLLLPRTPAPPTVPTTELGLQDALTALKQAIVAAYGAFYTITFVQALNLTIAAANPASAALGFEVDFGGFCYGLQIPCNGDNRDAHYFVTAFTPMFYPPTVAPGMFEMVIGVNHVLDGGAGGVLEPVDLQPAAAAGRGGRDGHAVHGERQRVPGVDAVRERCAEAVRVQVPAQLRVGAQQRRAVLRERSVVRVPVPGRLHAGPGADQHDGRRLLRGPCVR